MDKSPRRTGQSEHVSRVDVGRDHTHPALIALARLLARSAAGADFGRAKAQQEAGYDEAE